MSKIEIENSHFNCRSIEEVRFLYISTIEALLTLDLKEREQHNRCIVFDLVTQKDKKAVIGVKASNFNQVIELFESKYAEVHNEKPIPAKKIRADFVRLGMIERKTRRMSDSATNTPQTDVVSIPLDAFFMWNNVSILHDDTKAEMAKGNTAYMREWLEQQENLKIE